MSVQLLTLSEVSINKAGYLVSNEGNKPVTHAAFVSEQKQAEYVVKLSKALVGKTFTPSNVDNLEAIKKSVLDSINADAKVSYVDAPAKPTNSVNDELVQFALDFVNYEGDKSKAEKVNNFMQQFNTISAISEVGDYFNEGLVKLNKIYSIAEILEAVKLTVDKLD